MNLTDLDEKAEAIVRKPNWLQRRRLNRKLAKYLSPETIANALNQDTSFPKPPESRSVEFILVRVRECPIETLPRLITSVVQTAIQQDATIDTIVSSLIVLVYGAARQIAEPEEARRNLVHCLPAQLQADICVIHGSASCLVGTFGAETCWSFGVHIPGFSGLLGRLATLPLGEVVDVTVT